jgi:hypothetical protein
MAEDTPDFRAFTESDWQPWGYDRIPDYRNCYPTEGPIEIHVTNMDL